MTTMRPQLPETDTSVLWKARFRLPATYASLARHNPERGLVLSNREGVFQLYAWDVPSGALRRLTDLPTGTTTGVLSPDGRFVCYFADDHGNELGHFVRVPFEGGEPEDISPELPPYASWSLAFSGQSNRVAFMAATPEGFGFYHAPITGSGEVGQPTLLYLSPRLAASITLSGDGTLAVIPTTERSGKAEFSLLAFDLLTGERVAELWDGEGNSIEARLFSPVPGDSRVAATSNQTGDARPLLWDVRTGERTDLPLGTLQGEVFIEDWSTDGRSLLLKHFQDAVQQLYVFDVPTGTLRRIEHPPGAIGRSLFTVSGEVLLHWQDSTQAPQVITLEPESGKRARTLFGTPDAPSGRKWRSVHFPSTDGTTVQGWLGVPEGDGPFPTILDIHGGPTAVQTETYSAPIQAWLDHGYAVLSVNYRGSTTFGKAFEQRIWGDLGHWEMEDLVAARDWLVQEGVAEADEVFLSGWSYGGYLTLLGLGRRPDLWAGGLAGIAIADWTVQYEDSAETLKGYQVALFGGTPADMPEQYAASSTVTYAEQVAAPVLVIQGRNDTRCPARGLIEYEQKLRSLGKDIMVEWFDAGHGSYDVEQSIRHYELMLQFAHRVRTT